MSKLLIVISNVLSLYVCLSWAFSCAMVFIDAGKPRLQLPLLGEKPIRRWPGIIVHDESLPTKVCRRERRIMTEYRRNRVWIRGWGRENEPWLLLSPSRHQFSVGLSDRWHSQVESTLYTCFFLSFVYAWSVSVNWSDDCQWEKQRKTRIFDGSTTPHGNAHQLSWVSTCVRQSTNNGFRRKWWFY